MSVSLYKTLELKRNDLMAERETLKKIYNKQFFLFRSKLVKEKIDILTGKIEQLDDVLIIIKSNRALYKEEK